MTHCCLAFVSKFTKQRSHSEASCEEKSHLSGDSRELAQLSGYLAGYSAINRTFQSFCETALFCDKEGNSEIIEGLHIKLTNLPDTS